MLSASRWSGPLRAAAPPRITDGHPQVVGRIYGEVLQPLASVKSPTAQAKLSSDRLAFELEVTRAEAKKTTSTFIRREDVPSLTELVVQITTQEPVPQRYDAHFRVAYNDCANGGKCETRMHAILTSITPSN